MAQSGYSDGPYSSSFWGGFQDLDLTLTGVLGSTGLGNVASFQAANIVAPSYYNQGHIGSVLVRIPVTVSVSGVEGASVSCTGWGNGAWGELVWGGGVYADIGQVITPLLPAIVGNVNAPTIIGDATVSLTGVSGASVLESVLVGAGALVSETGMSGAVGLGDEAVHGDCNLTLTGVSGAVYAGDEHVETDTGAPVTNVPGMTVSLGDESVVIDALPTVSGFALTGSVGSVAITGTSVLSLTGVEGSGNISSVILWGRIVPPQNTIWIEEAA